MKPFEEKGSVTYIEILIHSHPRYTKFTPGHRQACEIIRRAWILPARKEIRNQLFLWKNIIIIMEPDTGMHPALLVGITMLVFMLLPVSCSPFCSFFWPRCNQRFSTKNARSEFLLKKKFVLVSRILKKT
jgi:hypothetical protein